MHFNTLTTAALLASAATALPLHKRQGLSSLFGGGGSGGGGLSSLFGGGGGSSGATGACTEYTFLFARGTTESGTLGTLGKPLGNALNQALGGGVTSIGTEYPASVMGNMQFGGAGGPRMAQDGKAALQRCPNTKLIIGGYSQGAMVATNAVVSQGLPADKIVAALLFGNPFHNRNKGQIRGVQTLSICNTGDGVCLTGGFAITPAHLTYPFDGAVKEAVQFATQAAQRYGGGSGGGAAGGGAGGSTGGAAGGGSSSGGGGLMSLLGGGGSGGGGGLGSMLRGGGGSSGGGGLSSLMGGGSGGGLSSLMGGGSGGGLSSLMGGGSGGGLSSLMKGAGGGGGGLSSLLGGLGGGK